MTKPKTLLGLPIRVDPTMNPPSQIEFHEPACGCRSCNQGLRDFGAAFIEANPEKFPEAHLALEAQRRRYEAEVERLKAEVAKKYEPDPDRDPQANLLEPEYRPSYYREMAERLERERDEARAMLRIANDKLVECGNVWDEQQAKIDAALAEIKRARNGANWDDAGVSFLLDRIEEALTGGRE